jgi:hypothetical protein
VGQTLGQTANFRQTAPEIRCQSRVCGVFRPTTPKSVKHPLPPGDYEVSFGELRNSVLVFGPGAVEEQSSWDMPWRLQLIKNLEILTRQLWQVGIRDIFADGSFAEDKDHPNDIDGYFVCSLDLLRTGELARQLNLLDPFKIWTWDPASRKPYRGYPKKQLPMWHRYRVELYPHVPGLGIGTGIRDRYGHELEFPSAFRQSRRDGKPRGIVKIKHGGQT